MQTATKPSPTLLTVPLARGSDGAPFEVPAEAALWLVRRQTRGRPRNLVGADRKPLTVPCDFTEQDLDNMLGPGSYRLDLCDANGKPLNVAVTVDLRDAELDAKASEPITSEPLFTLPSGVSDVRLVLEANVRATQMAFQHNERTLTASLRMADTLRDGIRDLATAQAGWINTLASARGFFRNAAPFAALPAPVQAANDESDGDDSDDEDEPEDQVAAPTNIYDVLLPFSEKAAELAPMLMASRSTEQKTSNTSGKVARSWLPSLADCLDWRRAEEKQKIEQPVTAEEAPPSEEEVDAKLGAKALAVMNLLPMHERLRMMRLVPKFKEDPEVLAIVRKLMAMTDADACTWIQTNLDAIEARFQ